MAIWVTILAEIGFFAFHFRRKDKDDDDVIFAVGLYEMSIFRDN